MQRNLLVKVGGQKFQFSDRLGIETHSTLLATAGVRGDHAMVAHLAPQYAAVDPEVSGQSQNDYHCRGVEVNS
jgi:hypothetical protein